MDEVFGNIKINNDIFDKADALITLYDSWSTIQGAFDNPSLAELEHKLSTRDALAIGAELAKCVKMMQAEKVTDEDIERAAEVGYNQAMKGLDVTLGIANITYSWETEFEGCKEDWRKIAGAIILYNKTIL